MRMSERIFSRRGTQRVNLRNNAEEGPRKEKRRRGFHRRRERERREREREEREREKRERERRERKGGDGRSEGRKGSCKQQSVQGRDRARVEEDGTSVMEAGLPGGCPSTCSLALPDSARQCFESRVHRWVDSRSTRELVKLATLGSSTPFFFFFRKDQRRRDPFVRRLTPSGARSNRLGKRKLCVSAAGEEHVRGKRSG